MTISSGSKFKKIFLAIFALELILIFFFLFFINIYGDDIDIAKHNQFFQENKSYESVSNYLTQLAEKEGAVHAFDVLIKGDLPDGMDTHLLGHEVGNVMYRQEGLGGMKYCDSSLGYACAHSVVINALVNEGQIIFEKINNICASVGIAGSYDMCFHGFGHGVLAYAEYDVQKAVELCELVGTDEHAYYESIECLGGVIMEMRGGIHNEYIWEQKKDLYLDEKDPLKMCKADYMPDDFEPMCYTYITPFIFDAVTSNDIPRPHEFEQSMEYCESINDVENREACYGGFGKEYISLIHGRDVRKIADTTIEEYKLVHDWCGYAKNTKDQSDCVKYAGDASYRAGSMPYETAILFCKAADSKLIKDKCFKNLAGSASYFQPSDSYKDKICSAFPSEYQGVCYQAYAVRTDLDINGSPN